MDMFSPFGAGHFSILLKQNVTLIVLVNYFLSDIVSLCLHELFGTLYLRHFIMCPNKLRFSGASSIRLVLPRKACCRSSPHVHHCSSMNLAVIVDCIRCIHIPLNYGQFIRCQGQFQTNSPLDILEDTSQFEAIVFIWFLNSCS